MPKINIRLFTLVYNHLLCQSHIKMSFRSHFHDLFSDDVLQKSFYSLMPVLDVRREGEDKHMEYLIENSSDGDDIVNKTDLIT